MFDIFNIYQFLLNQRHHWTLLKKTTFATLQCEYRESGSEVSVNTDLVLQNWGPIPTSGLRPSVGIGPQFFRTSVCIYRYLLSRLTVFPQAVSPTISRGISPAVSSAISRANSAAISKSISQAVSPAVIQLLAELLAKLLYLLLSKLLVKLFSPAFQPTFLPTFSALPFSLAFQSSFSALLFSQVVN